VVAIEWLALALVAVSYPLWLLIYVRYLLPKIREDNIGALERGEIEINPDWFSGVIDSIVERTRHLMLADLGNLARAPAAALSAGESDLGGGDDAGAAVHMAEQLLKAVGMKKPPPLLVFKTAQVLGQMALQQQQPGDAVIIPTFENFGQ